MKILFLFIFQIYFLNNCLNATVVGNIPGLIPLDNSSPPATDLIYGDRILLSHEAINLKDKGEDLSLLNPQESDIWRDEKDPTFSLVKKIKVNNFDQVSYLSPVLSRTGNSRFTISKTLNSETQYYTVMISKKIHNVLLRAALLKKLGYIVPQIKYIKKLTLSFDSSFEKENFLSRLSEDTFGDPARWVVNNEKEKEVEIQDLIIMNSNEPIYNLAIGHIPSNIIQGRRVLNSLLIPYSLVYVSESVNLLNWNLGQVISRMLKLEFDSNQEFTTSLDDAKWIARRIKELSRQDFQEIVKAANLPNEVSLVLVEKLIARRNSLLEVLSLTFKKLKFNSRISHGDYLKNGKLLKENWDGYGSRFAYGDPDSPLSGSELFSFFKSKLISNIISNLMSAFNKFVLPRTDIQSKVMEHQLSKMYAAYDEYLKTGVDQTIPFGIYAIPNFGVDLHASRDIVVGTYLGTDNLVQIADSLGASLRIGAYLGTDGLPVVASVDGGVNAYVTRKYSHLRPITSMKQAIKLPYKNMMIPYYKKKNGNMLDGLMSITNLDLEDQAVIEKIESIVSEFKDQIKVGESLVVTDMLGGGVQIGAGYNFTQILKAQLKFYTGQTILSRLHIHRANKNLIQVYKDRGQAGNFGMSFGFNSIIPIINVNLRKNKGIAKINFYNLNIDSELEDKTALLKNLKALRSVFVSNDLELLNYIKKPFVVKHDFNENLRQISLFHWRWDKKELVDFITVTHPEGNKKYFLKSSSGKRKGKDYQKLGTEVVNGLLAGFLGNNLALSGELSGNPGDTFLGSSVVKEVSFEAEIINYNKKSKTGTLQHPFVNISNIWKGWSLSYKKAKKLLSKLNQNYGFDFYPETVLNTTEKLQLYTVSLNIYFYKDAVENLIKQTKKRFVKIFENHSDIEDIIYHRPVFYYQPGNPMSGNSYSEMEVNTKEDQIYYIVRKIGKYQKKYKKYKHRNRFDKQIKYVVKLLKYVEKNLPLKGIAEAIGGKNNFFVSSKIKGFRKGDEQGDSPIVASTIGEFGDTYFGGPLVAIKNRLGMTESEFFSYWLIGKL
jgi:hypothetical protein